MRQRKSARFFLLDKDNKVLLFRFKQKHKAPVWATPGGEIEEGENVKQAAKRELYEGNWVLCR